MTPPPSKLIGLTFAALVEAWAAECQPPRKSREKWDATFAGMARLIGHDDATQVCLSDVVTWKQHRFAQGRSTKTVADGIAVMRSTFNWGIKNGLLPDKNPFSGAAPKVRKHGLAARDGYTDDQAAAVLQAARNETGWLRWLPWLLCFSGGRIEEIAELRCRDIRQESGVWILDIRPSECSATITPNIISSLRSSILILIDAPSHPDCRATLMPRSASATTAMIPTFMRLAAGMSAATKSMPALARPSRK